MAGGTGIASVTIRSVLAQFWLWRWCRSAALLALGTRIHPSAVLMGHVQLDRGCKIGSRVRIDAGSGGRVHIGTNAWLSTDIEVQTATEVRIGEGTTVQRRCTINGSTRIGAGCIFAPNVFVSSGTHPFRAIAHLPIREQERRLAADGSLDALDRPVWIQDDCWLGTNAVVCPGVTIGKGSVVGANAVVTRDVPPYSVVAGSPARVIGRRLQWAPRPSLRADRDEDRPYVLSGRVLEATADRPACIEVTADLPLLAALTADPALRGVALHGHTARPMAVEANGQRFALPAGVSRLEIPAAALQATDGAILCSLKLLGADADATLRVYQLEVVREIESGRG
jgi:acetyltransferase-like isoleucine patch superfamily enzyme